MFEKVFFYEGKTLIQLSSGVNRWEWVEKALAWKGADHFDDVVIGWDEVLLFHIGQKYSSNTLDPLLQNSIFKPNSINEIQFDITLAGKDFDLFLAFSNQSRMEFIESLENMKFKVSMVGFLPGFAYQQGLPETWQMPRLKSPRVKVEALSLAIGGPYLGIYPDTSPGGWNIIGKCQNTLPKEWNIGDIVTYQVKT